MSKRKSCVNQGLRLLFGIFMVLVYLGMAVLLAIDYFDWSAAPMWRMLRWTFAIILAAYGLYRGYREVTGDHTYAMRRTDDEEGYTMYGKNDNNQTGQR